MVDAPAPAPASVKDTRSPLQKSWEFLEVMANKVKEFFSANDKKQVVRLGTELAAQGMVYQHQVKVTATGADQSPGMKKSAEKDGGEKGGATAAGV